jgi:large subunit ribosomal protein L9
MKIILQQKVDKLGVPGDVVDVADGYARNYLIPRGIAVRASKGAVRHVESLKRAHATRDARDRQAAEALAGRLVGSPLRVSARAGEEGRLFGSVTTSEIAAALSEQSGVDVDRHDIHLDEPIRSVGMHEVRIHLHPEVMPVVSVEVVPAG